MCKYFPEPKSSGGRVKVDIDLSNYATKQNQIKWRGYDSSFKSRIDEKMAQYK